MRSRNAAVILVSVALLSWFAVAAQAQTAQPPAAQPPANAPLQQGLYAFIDTTEGQIVCRLLPKEAPKTVENFVGLATGKKAWTDPRDGKEKHTPLYNGLIFHRVIKGFMIQAGDPLGTGEGGPGFAIDLEVSPNLHFDAPGKLAMARQSEPNTAGSQFFITTAASPWLEGKYAIFGEVVRSQDVVDKISVAETEDEDRPVSPVNIQKITIRNIAVPQSTPHSAARQTPAK